MQTFIGFDHNFCICEKWAHLCVLAQNHHQLTHPSLYCPGTKRVLIFKVDEKDLNLIIFKPLSMSSFLLTNKLVNLFHVWTVFHFKQRQKSFQQGKWTNYHLYHCSGIFNHNTVWTWSFKFCFIQLIFSVCISSSSTRSSVCVFGFDSTWLNLEWQFWMTKPQTRYLPIKSWTRLAYGFRTIFFFFSTFYLISSSFSAKCKVKQMATHTHTRWNVILNF